MKLILRRENSSTSILLFLYNLVYSKAQKESFLLSSLLEIMGKFDKAETATRMALSRASRNGILEIRRTGESVVYSVTPAAIEIIQSWNQNAQSCWNRIALRNNPWKGKWHMIQIMPDAVVNKDMLSGKLRQIGYAQVSAQTWISPYNQPDAVNSIIEEINGHKESVSVYGDLAVNTDIFNFLEKIFGLSGLKEQYVKFSDAYQPLLECIGQDISAVADGKALPVLHRLGFSYFNIATTDPMLPKKLLPQWPGDQAAAIMRDLRQILENAAWEYLKEFK